MTEKLVVVGAGMASGRMLEHLFEAEPNAFDVTLFGAEPRGNYNRIMLSPVLAGEKAFEQIVTHDTDWYAANRVTCRFGETVTRIDRKRKVVLTAGGEARYDKLVVATGSAPFIIPVAGRDLPGVMAFRDLDDVNAMIAAAEKPNARAVVIGGGLLGLEAAAALRGRGMEVVVLHLMGHLMERQLDPAAGYLLKKELEDRGIRIHTEAQTKAILGDERAEAVLLDDGTIYPADIVVMAVGIRPETRIATDAGLHVERGIVVDDRMMSSDPDILAIGECVEHQGICYGLVAPLYDMAKVAARTLVGEEAAFRPVETATQLKVTGVSLYSAGDFAEADDREEIVLRDASAGVYKRLVLKDNRIMGAVLYGETSDGGWFFDMLRRGTDVSDMRETLIFGQAYQGGGQLDPMAAVAALPDDAEICGCNGVCKGKITGAITGKGLASLDDVRAHTKASASCGTCTGLVEQLLSLTLGDTYNPAAVTPVCGCTDLGHDEVRRLIRAKRLKTIPAVMQELEWKTSCGCAKCRPALNYYLVSDWPDEYADDYQSRFINERVHANIQKDGTYSVVPRMWGGVTSSAELRAIADVVDRFDIPAVKVTGGQRIDMLGIRKQDLPAVWAELGKAGFVSGHAYAKGLRTVKTCVGSDWCRFGTQDSTGLGIRIEKFMWGSWTPAKVKMAVSGCPRNCAEATCKDVGVICVESGFEIHFAGAAGLDIKGTEKLGLVRSEDEALEHIVALVQMYREQGHYLERIYKWAKRIGYDEVRRQIMDDADRRKAYFDRFVFSQRFAQVDPWSERVSGKDKHEFRPMATLSLEAAE
ncbi:nitrite reductase large subunit NirB [Nitratireductor sp. L1-7-SE]|uniref:Nitrite reductase large subunit NirB n=1 Tax=Nitratireductor rhodophyticola TaxID=2854036 RepID=A0ABS7RBC7_9HYPH|nr:nitrite reductase large subunit NirB [Nitratireductor rhodophyticola]MBY8917919.1 nitrite reductase large subunit NirB [Nitratireductor rhodophyticola]MBY8922630.1 nitrite reductase large subunit NirB [Nitratireductor rhodophyticola]